MIKKSVMVIVGTRPEGIKMAPVYHALRDAGYAVYLCATMQHKDLLQPVLDLFHIKPDISLDIMKSGQDLFYLTTALLDALKNVLIAGKPGLVLVQGDTTTAFVAALAAFYLQIPIGHIEAGLRTYNNQEPFPEEINRKLISSLAHLHFAPTKQASDNLRAESISAERIVVTGNTGIDALHMVVGGVASGLIVPSSFVYQKVKEYQQESKKIILLTIHRRESFGQKMISLLCAVKHFLQEHKEVVCFYPYHPNPQVKEAIDLSGIADIDNVYLCAPLAYQDLVYVLQVCQGVVTDSGGIQEEATTLGKEVLVMRTVTERVEGVELGTSSLVGTDKSKFIDRMHKMVMSRTDNKVRDIYGDGYAAARIVEEITRWFDGTKNIKRMHV